LTGTVIDNRLILVTALNCLASGIIICHNHPSGNLQPSEQDIHVTKKLKSACDLLEIKILDHVILTDESHFSMADNGII
jgi:DNA repair protein RadC